MARLLIVLNSTSFVTERCTVETVLLKKLILFMHLCLRVHAHPCKCLGRPEEATRSPRVGLTRDCEPLNMGLLKQNMLLSAEPSLQLQVIVLMCHTFII